MKIILVDDEKIMQMRLTDAIKEIYPEAELFIFGSSVGVEECLLQNDISVAFLDINLPGKNGIELGKRLKIISPKLNIVFCTGYDEYSFDAIEMHASAYLLKPITTEKVRNAMNNLIYPPAEAPEKKIRFSCFGVFKAFFGNQPLKFQYTKTEEMLAFLVDRKGELIKPSELDVCLFEDDGKHTSYVANLRNDLIKTLETIGASDALEVSWGRMGIRREAVSCDYFDWLENKPSGINAFHGEYMSQYDWAQYTLSKILEK